MVDAIDGLGVPIDISVRLSVSPMLVGCFVKA
jgi:hypothetical protein